MSQRVVVVSADCHAGPLPEQARSYVDPEFRDAFDAWLDDDEARARRQSDHTGQAIYGDEALEDFTALDAVSEGGLDGAWDSARRLAELEADGVVAEVIYPGGGGLTISPFDVGLMTYQYEQDPPIWAAGCRAYNRWLADFCNEAPGRRAGVALVTVDDLDATVREVDTLRDRGIFGGVLLASGTGANPLYNHARYEPLWAACAANRLPIHTHSGWTPNYGDFQGSLGIFITEITWFAHRAFWLLAWSGAFERNVDLRLVMTEQGATWIPDTLAQMDHAYDMPMFRHLRRQLPLSPSQYFAAPVLGLVVRRSGGGRRPVRHRRGQLDVGIRLSAHRGHVAQHRGQAQRGLRRRPPRRSGAHGWCERDRRLRIRPLGLDRHREHDRTTSRPARHRRDPVKV